MKTLPKKPWEESVENYPTRLRACVAHINARFNVEGLCRELPQRVGMLEASKGDRISK